MQKGFGASDIYQQYCSSFRNLSVLSGYLPDPDKAASQLPSTFQLSLPVLCQRRVRPRPQHAGRAAQLKQRLLRSLCLLATGQAGGIGKRVREDSCLQGV